MKRLFLSLLAVLILPALAYAQNTTVTGTITDSAGQLWYGGSYKFHFYPSPINPEGPYYLNGVLWQPTDISGSLDQTLGTFSASVPSNTSITPSGSKWTLTVCPQTDTPCYSTNLTITGTSMSVTSLVTPPGINIDAHNPATVNVRAYNDQEIYNAFIGYKYTDIGKNKLCVGVNPPSGTGTSPLVTWQCLGAAIGGSNGLQVNGLATTNSVAPFLGNLNNTTPAAPAGYNNCTWQADAADPSKISCYVPATGGGIQVNGGATTNSVSPFLGNFNSTTPAPDTGYTACTWKSDTANPSNIICELPNGNSAGPMAANINEVQPAPGGATTVFHTTGASDQTLQVANQITLSGKLTNLVPWQPQLSLTHWSGPTIPPGAGPGIRQQEGCSVAASPNYTCTFAATSPTIAGTELIAWQYASTQTGGGQPTTFTDNAGDTFTSCTNASAIFGCLQATSIGGATSFTCTVTGNVQSGAANCMVVEITNYGGLDVGSVGGNAQTGNLPETATVSITTVSANDLLLVEAGEGTDWPCYAQKATLSGAGIVFGGPNYNASNGGLGGGGPMWAVFAAAGAGAIGTYTVKLTVDAPSQGAASCYDGNPSHGDAAPTINIFAIKPLGVSTGKDIPAFRYFTCFDWAAMDLGASDTAWAACNSSLPPNSSFGTVTSVTGTTNQIAVANPTTTPVLSITNPFIFPGKATFAAGATGASSFNIPTGVAPTSPVTGDVWSLGTGQFQLFDGTNPFNFARVPTTGVTDGHLAEFDGTTGKLKDGGAPGGSITLENGGSSLGTITTLNCSTGTTCTASSGTGTLTASGSGGATTAQQAQVQAGPISVPNSSGSISPLFNCAGDGNFNVPVGCQSSRPLVVGEQVTFVLTGDTNGTVPNASCAATGNNTWTRRSPANTSNAYIFTTTVTVAGTETLTFTNCSPSAYLMTRVKGWATYNTGAIDSDVGTLDANCTEGANLSTCSIGITSTYANELHVAIPNNPNNNAYTGLSVTPSGPRVLPQDLGFDSAVFAFGNPSASSTTVTAYATLSGTASYDRLIVINYLPAAASYVTLVGVKANTVAFTSSNALSLTSGKLFLLKLGDNTNNTTACTISDTQGNTFTRIAVASPTFYTFIASATGSDTVTISGASNCGANPGVTIMGVWQLVGIQSVSPSSITNLPNSVLFIDADSLSSSSISVSPAIQSLDSSATNPSYLDVVGAIPASGATAFTVTCPSCSANTHTNLALTVSSPITGPVGPRVQACSDNAEHCTQTVTGTAAANQYDLGQYDGFSQTLGADVTSASYINGKDGRAYSFTICEPSSGGPWTFAPPSNSVNFPQVNLTASACTHATGTWSAASQEMVFPYPAPATLGIDPSASPNLGAACAGFFTIQASATTAVVDSTCLGANSVISIQPDSSLGAALGVTCNTTTPAANSDYISARTAGTSFTVTTSAAPTTNPACYSFHILNPLATLADMPPVINGLVWHFDANAETYANSAAVTVQHDFSTLNATATANSTGATFATNAQNSRSAIVYPGTSAGVYSLVNVSAHAAATFFIVQKFNSACTGMQFGSSSNGGYVSYTTTAGKLGFAIQGSAGVTNTSTLTTATWYIQAITSDGSGNWAMYTNGSADGSGASLPGTSASFQTNLLGDDLATDYSCNTVGEVLMYNRVLTTVEINSMFTWLDSTSRWHVY